MAKAIGAGYISGYPDGTVRPNKEISRQEAAVALCKALNLSLKYQAPNFTDGDGIPPWSRDYIGTLAEKGYMTGYPDGSFRPERFISRAETITMLDKALAGEKGEYYLPGVYGPEEGIQTIKQDLVINVPGLTLRNMNIEGNLYLGEGIAESYSMNESQTVMGNYDEKGAVCVHVSRNEKKLTATVSDRDYRIDFSDRPDPHIVTYKVTKTEHTAYVDGIQTSKEDLTESINWGKTTIGKNGSPTSSYVSDWHWQGTIAEIRIYDRALSDEQRETVEELQEKWFGAPGEPGRAYVYYNPYEDVDWETYGQYKANFHAHTNQSDGSFTPDEVIDKYHGAGYKILDLTDHDSYGYNADTTWPWTKWDRNPEELGMLAIEGNELSNTDHIGSLFNDYGGPRAGEEELALQKVRERNGLAIMHHPG